MSALTKTWGIAIIAIVDSICPVLHSVDIKESHRIKDWPYNFGNARLWVTVCNTSMNPKYYICTGHGVPKGGQKEKKLSGFGTYIFGIGIPRGLILW